MKLKRAFTILIILISFIGCKNQQENEKLRLENEEMKKELEKVKSEKEEIKHTPILKQHTVEEAENLVQDYFSFYKNDFAYRNLQIRKTNSNIFDVRLQEGFKHSFEGEDYVWNSVTYKLEILDDGKYNFDRKY